MMKPLHDSRMVFALLLVAASWTSAPCLADAHGSDDPGVTIHGDLGRSLDDYLSRMEAFGFHGAMLVEIDGTVVLAKGYGTADRGRDLPITTRTVFDIGSLGKQFIAAGALLLESWGMLSVNDPIEEHLHDVPEDKRGITIHQLLTHTAGLPYLPRSSDALAEPLASVPGERWAYSNVGYTVLGRVIDAVAGEPFEDFLTREIFREAGMNGTWFRKDLPATQPHQARAYTGETDQGTPAEMRLPANLRGAGDVISTLGDLLRWEHALRTHAILDASSTQRFFTEHVRNDAGTMGYAYGWMVFQTPRDTRIVSHAGNYGGFNCDYRRYVDEGMTIVCLSNHFINGRSMRDAVMNNVSLIALGHEAKWPPKPILPSLAGENAGLSGRFEVDGGGVFEVERIDGRLHLRADAQRAMMAVFLPDATEAEHEFAAFASRESERVVRALFAGDTEPFGEHVSPSLPHSAGRSIAARCAALIDELGPVAGGESLGAMLATESNGRVVVRVRFDQGVRLIQLTWSGGRIVHFSEADQLPAREFLPIGNGAFAAYDIFTHRGATVRIEPAADDEEAVLRIGAGENESLARRVHRQTN